MLFSVAGSFGHLQRHIHLLLHMQMADKLKAFEAGEGLPKLLFNYGFNTDGKQFTDPVQFDGMDRFEVQHCRSRSICFALQLLIMVCLTALDNRRTQSCCTSISTNAVLSRHRRRSRSCGTQTRSAVTRTKKLCGRQSQVRSLCCNNDATIK